MKELSLAGTLRHSAYELSALYCGYFSVLRIRVEAVYSINNIRCIYRRHHRHLDGWQARSSNTWHVSFKKFRLVDV